MIIPEAIKRPLQYHRDGRRDPVQGGLIHAMGERIVVGDEVIDAWGFLDRSKELVGKKLSAHRLFNVDGTIIDCVDDENEAYHAGVSAYRDLENLNRSFLGAEFLLRGEWVYDPFRQEMRRGNVGYTAAQYNAAGWQYATWMLEHEFPRDMVVSHSVVSDDAVRGEGKGKTDPGVGFNRGRLTMAINRWIEELNERTES